MHVYLSSIACPFRSMCISESPMTVLLRGWVGAPISTLLHLRQGLAGASALAGDGIRCGLFFFLLESGFLTTVCGQQHLIGNDPVTNGPTGLDWQR